MRWIVILVLVFLLTTKRRIDHMNLLFECINDIRTSKSVWNVVVVCSQSCRQWNRLFNAFHVRIYRSMQINQTHCKKTTTNVCNKIETNLYVMRFFFSFNQFVFIFSLHFAQSTDWFRHLNKTSTIRQNIDSKHRREK